MTEAQDQIEAKEGFDKLVSRIGPFDYTWKQWDKIAEFVSHVDFGCRFTKRGCNGDHGRYKRGCCHNCAQQRAWYTTYIPSADERIRPEAVKAMSSLWDRHNGFWSPQGCVLPINLRSPVCLRFYCDFDLCDDHVNSLAILRNILAGGLFVPGKSVKRRLPPQLQQIKTTLQRVGAWK